MAKTFEQFYKLSKEAQAKYLSSDNFGLSKYLKKGFALLSDRELETVFNLKKLDEQAIQFAKQFSEQAQKLLPQVIAIAQTGLSGNLQSVKKPVIELLSAALTTSFGIVSKNFNDGVKNGDSLLLGGTLASGAATILESVLAVEKKINIIHPNLSEKIIDGLGVGITLAIATQSPPAAIAFKASGLTEVAKNFLDCDNLEKSIKFLRSRTEEVKADPKLAPLLEQADQIAKAAAETGLDAATLLIADLSKEALVNASKIAQDDNSKNLAQELNKEAAKISLSEEMIKEQTNNIKNVLDKVIDNSSGLNPTQTKTIKEALSAKIDEASKILAGSLDKAQSLIQKIEIGSKAVDKILSSFPNTIDSATKKSISTKLGEVIDQQLPRLTTILIEGLKKSPQLAKAVGLTEVLKLALQKIIPQKETGKAR